jgi:hypothetical protein
MVMQVTATAEDEFDDENDKDVGMIELVGCYIACAAAPFESLSASSGNRGSFTLFHGVATAYCIPTRRT